MDELNLINAKFNYLISSNRKTRPMFRRHEIQDFLFALKKNTNNLTVFSFTRKSQKDS
jgi:hypothetical protein